MTTPPGRPCKFDADDEKEILKHSGIKRKGHRTVARLVSAKRRKIISPRAVRTVRRRAGLKKFRVKKRPLITKKNIIDRMTFCEDVIGDWTDRDAMHLVPSDEFFIYNIRKPNGQNDVMWARSREELKDPEYVGVPRHPTCLGLFLMFSVKGMFWSLKKTGQSWNGAYFRDFLSKKVIPWLKDKKNVRSPKKVVFLHDKAPCMKARATQQLLRESGIDFFDNSEWPGNSPDLNPAENVGAILKDRVEATLDRRRSKSPVAMKQLRAIVGKCCRALAKDKPLFKRLLKSFLKRRKAVLLAKGGHTDY